MTGCLKPMLLASAFASTPGSGSKSRLPASRESAIMAEASHVMIIVIEDDPPIPYGKVRGSPSSSVSPYSVSSSVPPCIANGAPRRRPDWTAMPAATPPRVLPRTPVLSKPMSPSACSWQPDWSGMPTPTPLRAIATWSPDLSRCPDLALRPFRLVWLAPLTRKD